MTLSEKVAYLKGVAEGLKFDPDKTTEGKLISIMMDILEHLSLNTEEDDDSIQALADQLDDVSDSLAMLEDYVYSEEFPDIEDEYNDEEDDAEEALQALEEDGFFELECQLRRHAGRGQERAGFRPRRLPRLRPGVRDRAGLRGRRGRLRRGVMTD